jgi:hypothetical protein
MKEITDESMKIAINNAERELLNHFREIEKWVLRNNLKIERIKIEAREVGKNADCYYSIDFPVRFRKIKEVKYE